MLIRSQTTALMKGVERYFWYDLVNDKNDRADHEGNFGLFTQPIDGVAAYPPKPAAFTQALLISKLNGGEYLSVDDIAGVFSYAFSTDDDEELRVAWSTEGVENATYPASGTITSTNSRGEVVTYEPVDGVVTVQVSATPVMLTGDFSPADGTPSASPTPSPTADGD
jgi:hypothetical protein